MHLRQSLFTQLPSTFFAFRITDIIKSDIRNAVWKIQSNAAQGEKASSCAKKIINCHISAISHIENLLEYESTIVNIKNS